MESSTANANIEETNPSGHGTETVKNDNAYYTEIITSTMEYDLLYSQNSSIDLIGAAIPNVA
ncbi:hypothetical protein [Rickettsia endosymbiont of Oedothorax gibbosus]|uniref:hypothetical protein n=1 Tax=Rickettsia endosymbiont of Oedothorax gibbosus TaxID=931099 RepID=UPI002024EA36|nr:hypothetical protein [Rickettsia endosymbiont of Oedothorax gibbosus]